MGLTSGEIRRRAPELFAGEDGRWEWYFRTPDGETYEDFAGRIAAWLADLRDEPVIAVAHGVVTRVLRGLYAGMRRDAALRLAVPQDRVFPAGSRHDRGDRRLIPVRAAHEASSVGPLPRPTMERTAATGEREWRPICLN